MSISLWVLPNTTKLITGVSGLTKGRLVRWMAIDFSESLRFERRFYKNYHSRSLAVFVFTDTATMIELGTFRIMKRKPRIVIVFYRIKKRIAVHRHKNTAVQFHASLINPSKRLRCELIIRMSTPSIQTSKMLFEIQQLLRVSDS